MKIIIDFCSIFHPIVYILFGICFIIIYFINFYNKYNNAKKLSIINFKNYTKTNGIIKNFETQQETKIIKRNNKEEQIQIEQYLPIVEYTIDGKKYTTTYKHHFFKSIKPTIGYEFTIYIGNNDNHPYILYTDIYFNELKGAKITTVFISIFIFVLSIIFAIFSALG